MRAVAQTVRWGPMPHSYLLVGIPGISDAPVEAAVKDLDLAVHCPSAGDDRQLRRNAELALERHAARGDGCRPSCGRPSPSNIRDLAGQVDIDPRAGPPRVRRGHNERTY